MSAKSVRLAGDDAKAMPKRFAFTMRRLADLSCPAGKDRIYVYDEAAHGLALAVMASGRKIFYHVKGVDGTCKRKWLGIFPTLTLEDARKAVVGDAGKLAAGVKVFDQRRQERQAATFADIFTHYIETHAKPHKRTWADDEEQHERYLTELDTRKAADIRREDIARVHAKIGKDAPYAANRALALLRKVFNVAKAGGFLSGDNPAAGIVKFKEQSRDRFLSADELKRLFTALSKLEDTTVRDAILTALLTGARRSNVFGMQWNDLDLQAGIWTVPAASSKNGATMRLALAPQAITLLASRQGNGSAFVFDSYGASGHLEDVKAAWKAVCTAAKITDCRLHDLRRTVGSWAAASGASLLSIGKVLGHQSQQSTAVYARLDLQAARQTITAAVGNIAQQMPAGLLPAAETPNAKTE